jgi:ATP-dependent Clp protease ATP-binding subunit ClpA
VRRAIQRELQNPLAKTILEGRFKAGTQFRVGREGEGLKISAVG